MKLFKCILSLSLMFCFSCQTAEAARSAIKGDPDLLWLSPLGKEDIENTPYNRCLIIKKMKPKGSGEKINRDSYEILAEYTANLYAQSVKINAYIEEESKKEKTLNFGNINDEVSIIKKLVLRRLSDIARRVNIINSFEAGTSMLEALMAISSETSSAYEKIDCCGFLLDSECKKESGCKKEGSTCVSVSND